MTNTDPDLLLFGCIGLIPLIVLVSDEKRQKAVKLMTTFTWITQFILMLTFICYVLFISKNPTVQMRQAVYQGGMAFIIALCAAFDLTIAPFWLVFLTTLFFNN